MRVERYWAVCVWGGGVDLKPEKEPRGRDLDFRMVWTCIFRFRDICLQDDIVSTLRNLAVGKKYWRRLVGSPWKGLQDSGRRSRHYLSRFHLERVPIYPLSPHLSPYTHLFFPVLWLPWHSVELTPPAILCICVTLSSFIPLLVDIKLVPYHHYYSHLFNVWPQL